MEFTMGSIVGVITMLCEGLIFSGIILLMCHVGHWVPPDLHGN